MTVRALAVCITCVATGPAHAEDLMIGTGPITFTAPTTRDLLTVGASVEARFGFSWGRWLAFEVAYAGSLYRSDSASSLLGIGVEASARVGSTPYLVAGLGSTRYQWQAQMMSSDTDVGYVPIGIGARRHIGPVILDLRVTYRLAADASLMAGGRVLGQYVLDTWNLTLGIGFEL